MANAMNDPSSSIAVALRDTTDPEVGRAPALVTETNSLNLAAGAAPAKSGST